MIVGKWHRAAKVGTAAGAAQGAIIEADKAADLAKSAAEKSAKAVEKYGGADASKDASDKAKAAAEKATEKSTATQTQLDTVKGAIESSEFGGEGVDPADLSKLSDLTEETIKAAKTADEKAARALAFAADVKKSAMGDMQKAVKVVEELEDAAKPALEKSADFAQKASFAVKDVEAALTKAEDASKRLDKKIEGAHEQAPVGEGLKETLEAHKDPLTDMISATKDGIDGVKSAATDLSGKLEPLKAAREGAIGGDTALSGMAEDVTKAEGSLQKLEDKMEALMSAVTVMKKEEARLAASIKKAEEWSSGY